MDLALTEEQEMLKRSVADFMSHECPKSVLLELDSIEAGAPPELWQRIARLGWLGMLVPEEHGGTASSLLDAAVVFEQFGRGPLPGAFFSSSVLGALVIQEAGSEQQRATVLPAIASGEQVLTLALLEPERRWGQDAVQLEARRDNGEIVLNGVKSFVHDAVAATHIVVAVRDPAASHAERSEASRRGDEGISLVLVDKSLPGVTARLLPGFMGWVGEVRFDNVRVSSSWVLGEPGAGWPALERAMAKALPVLCAYQVGGCEAVFDLSVDYSRERVQFGQPIGRFQRVQDHIINITNHMDAARWTTYEALWKLDSGQDAARSVHLAKAAASEGYYQACNAAHEVHAGIGVSREYGLTLHTRMSRTLYQYLGDPAYHKRRLADVLF
jgi:alkylation response protein AidB-like acyl-CoA dehydrogenase